MSYNYRALSGRIAEKCRTQANFAEMIGISERSVSLKLNNKIPFNQNEIAKAIKVLEIRDTEISSYFFNSEVQNN